MNVLFAVLLSGSIYWSPMRRALLHQALLPSKSLSGGVSLSFTLPSVFSSKTKGPYMTEKYLAVLPFSCYQNTVYIGTLGPPQASFPCSYCRSQDVT